MTDGDQSREDVFTPIANLLKPKHLLKLGFWNVRTLYQTGKLAQATNELNQYNLDLMGMAEVRWTGSGKHKLATGETIIWSGRQDDNHHEGVAVLLRKTIANTLLQWKPVSERLLYVRFHSKFTKLSVLVGYAPTNDSEEEGKDDFYDSLQAMLEEIPAHDMIIFMGDLNARVGSNNKGRERVMGQQGLGEMTDNGERLVNTCEENNLVIGGTLFPHKNIHKLTWTSPDGRTQSQIDHIMINGKWRRSLLDVRVMRQADIGSDHNLLVAKIKLKLRKAKVGKDRRQRFDVSKLQDNQTKQKFAITLKNRFSTLLEETTMTIDMFNTAMRETGEKILGHRKSAKKEWISRETIQNVEDRRDLKKKLLSTRSERIRERLANEYREKDREVKNSARRDKRMYVERLAEEAETAARNQDMKTVYQTTRKLKGDFGQSYDRPVKAEDGTSLTTEEEKLQRWKQHFEKILNRPDPSVLADIPEADEDLDINLGEITVEEVKNAINKQKNGKAPGDDGVCAEMIKAEDQVTPQILCKIFQDIWDTENIPQEWKKGTIVKLPKKGDLSDCGNWRGITLLSLTSKIFTRIILQRLTGAIDNLLRQEQAGFRKGRSCIDHIFTLRQILEQTHEWNSSLYIAFVDFEKAFDSLHRDSLWKILRSYGFPTKIVNIIQALYNNFECKVIHDNKLTEPFEVKTGVKQGCILSPTLFSLAVDWIMRRTLGNRKTGIQWTLTSVLEDLDYADDISLLSGRYQDIQDKTETLSVTSRSVGLKISERKTQVLRKNTRIKDAVTVNNTPLGEVAEFVYLGSKVTAAGDCTTEINARISKAGQAFGMLRNIWKSTNLSIGTKIRIFKSNVMSVLLYGSECWKTTSMIEQKLEVFQNKCLRRILKVFWPNVIRNDDLLERTRMYKISDNIRDRRWRWLGHVYRMSADAIPRTALRWTPQGKRNRGRPKETWRRTMEKELKSKGLTLQTAARTAADRDQWRSLADASSTQRRRED